jgi:hypothetical protein
MAAEPTLHSPSPLDALVWRYGKGLPAPQRAQGLPTGFAELDRALPQRGWFGDGLNELLGNEQGWAVSLRSPRCTRLAEGRGMLAIRRSSLTRRRWRRQDCVRAFIVIRQAVPSLLGSRAGARSKACGAVVV